MKNSRTSYYRVMFLSAAVFNWLVGLALIVAYKPLFAIIGMAPIDAPLFLHLFALLVLAFGLGYYWISRDPAKERALILLGGIAKLGVFAAVAAYCYSGQASWQLLALATGDLIYSLAFAECLIYQGRRQRFWGDLLNG